MGPRSWWLLGALAACGTAPSDLSASDAGPLVVDSDLARPLDDAPSDGPDDAAVRPARAPFPVVRYRGGAILGAPEIVTITFPGDPLRPRLEAFGDAITQSAWWSAVADGYCVAPAGTPCVGKGSGGGHVALLGAPDSAYTAGAVASLIRDRVADGTFPPPHAGATIYTVFFPSGVTLEDGIKKSCADFAAYHSFIKVPPPGADAGAPVVVPYVAIARCAPAEADATIAAAHQLIDTATDPEGDAYATTDEAWSAFFSSEAADLCAAEAVATESGFAVPRVWSNMSAALGHNPCVPLAPGEVYFNASPPDQPVSLAKGESAVIDLAPFAEKAGADWSLKAVDYDELTGKPPTLALAIDRATVNDGTPAKLTVTLVNPPPERGFGLFALVSRRGNAVHYWPGRVLPK